MKMSELKVSLLNRRFFCGIALIFIAVLAVAHPYRAFLTESGGSVEGPAWMAVFIYGVSSERTLLFLPLFVPLGAAGDVQEELKSRYAVFLVSRAGKKNYLAGKILGAALSGGLTAVTAFAAALAVIVPWCAGIPDLSGQELQGILPQLSGQELQGFLPLLPAVLCGFLCGFLNGALWALAGSAAAVLTRNHYLGYAVPFILYYVLTVFQERYYDKSYFGAGVCVGILIFLIAAAGLLLMKLTERRLTG